MRILVPTCASYYWALRPFLHQMEAYWPDHPPIDIVGFEPLPFLPQAERVTFISHGGASSPVGEWSNGIMRYLAATSDTQVILMHEDYWLCRPVNHLAVLTLARYAAERQDVLRLDLTGDRLGSGRAYDVDHEGAIDIIETPYDTPYQMSHQAGIWNVGLWRQFLRPGETPQQAELWGGARLLARTSDVRVLGTRQWPVRYIPAIDGGRRLVRWNGYDYSFSFAEPVREMIRQWIPPGWGEVG